MSRIGGPKLWDFARLSATGFSVASGCRSERSVKRCVRMTMLDWSHCLAVEQSSRQDERRMASSEELRVIVKSRSRTSRIGATLDELSRRFPGVSASNSLRRWSSLNMSLTTT